MLARHLRDQPWRLAVGWPVGFEGGIAHRLDSSTSGALVVGDSLEELKAIREDFAQHRMKKTYRFITDRPIEWAENRCGRPIAHAPRHKGRMVVQRSKSTPHRGRWLPADTCFRRLAPGLVEAVIATGVMHQIRVHAAFLGIPLRGDRRYGGGAPIDPNGGLEFCLHHLGLEGPGGFKTDPVPLPEWATFRAFADR
jgi:23S rRNA-/tRNA-specific pseudouridylate synthase